MRPLLRYLVIDDDSTSNLICDFTIQRFDKEAERSLFTCPEEGLDYIRERGPAEGYTVLFLDVNMPTMSGFEFLKEFQELEEEIKKQYKIYMLTSSIEDFSEQAEEFPMVVDFLSKPMKLSYLEQIQEELKSLST